MMKRFLTVFFVLTLLFSLLLTSCGTRKRFGSSDDDDDEPKKSAKKDSEETEETETEETEETKETETADSPVVPARNILQEPEVRSGFDELEDLYIQVRVSKNGSMTERTLFYWTSDSYDFVLEEDDEETETEYYWFVTGDTIEKGVSSFDPNASIDPVTDVSDDQLESEAAEIYNIMRVFVLTDDLVDAASFEKLPDTTTEFGPAYVYNVLVGITAQDGGRITVDQETGFVVEYVYAGTTYEILDWDFYED